MGGWVNEHNMHMMGCHIVQSFLVANDYITGMNDAYWWVNIVDKLLDVLYQWQQPLAIVTNDKF